MFSWVDGPLSAEPVPCGSASDALLVRSWAARQGRAPGEKPRGTGVCIAEEAREEFASLPFTLEFWLTWSEGTVPLRRPAVLAEAEGTGWNWQFGFDHAGSLKLVWRAGEAVKVVASELLIDSIRPGAWYHVALAASAKRCTIAFTVEGTPIAQLSGGVQHPAAPGPVPEGDRARLSLGRSLGSEEPSPVHIGSAAWHATCRTVSEYPALGGAPLPRDLRLDQDFEYGNLGRAFALAKDTIVLTAGEKEPAWFAFRVRGAGGRTLRFLQLQPTYLSAFVSEDGGNTWQHPNRGSWRTFPEPVLDFTHKFRSNEAYLATTPPVTNTMADAWLERTAKRFRGRLREVGRSRAGRVLRVLEVGNPRAPWIYLQSGQHSMAERLGYYMATALFEAAAADAELLRGTRWMILPIVNVDSYNVGPPDGNMNRFWGKPGGPPTVKALERFLRGEAARTGGRVLLDWHHGTVWRGHTILAETDRGYSDPTGNADSLHLLGRESAFPEFEALLREEGVDYVVLNGFARNLPPRRNVDFGMIEGFALTQLGVRMALCIELSPIVSWTPEGAEPVSPENLAVDGVRWYRALKRYVEKL